MTSYCIASCKEVIFIGNSNYIDFVDLKMWKCGNFLQQSL